MKHLLKQTLFVCVLLCTSLMMIACATSASDETVKKGPAVEKSPYVLYPVDLPEVALEADETESAFDAVYKMKSGVNLGNGFDTTSFNETNFLKGEIGWIPKWSDINKPSSWEKAWGQPETSKALIQGIKAAGFNAVRVPVTWAEHIDFETGKINETWLNRIKEVVEWILEEDMYCLLNTHHDGGTEGWIEASNRAYEKYKNLYAKLYTQIGNTFKDYPELLILCGTNEMISAANQWGNGSAEAIKAVNQWNQLFVNTIRATGGKNASRNLMVGTYCCSTNEADLKAFVKPKDHYENHLIMEVHIYSPKEFVWEKESWLQNWTTEWKASFEAGVKSEFTRVKTYADSYKMPVIVGEWGTLSRRFPGKNKDGSQKWEATTDEEGAKFTNFFITESKARGFTSFYWDTQEIVDRKTGNITSPLMVEGIISVD